MKFRLVVITITVCLLLCGCASKPAYLNPYKDGSEVRPATASSINTTAPTNATAVTIETTQTTSLAVPEGYTTCPECNGEKLICDECNGVGRAPESIVEYFDEDSGVYVKKGDPCPHCELDPGYQYCDNCENQLYVPK